MTRRAAIAALLEHAQAGATSLVLCPGGAAAESTHIILRHATACLQGRLPACQAELEATSKLTTMSSTVLPRKLEPLACMLSRTGPLPISSFVRWRHTLTRPLVVQTLDILELNNQLEAPSSLEELALPVLGHSHVLNPDQVTRCLMHLPRLTRKQKLLFMPEQHALPAVLLTALIARFADVLPHLSHRQLASGLWGAAASSKALTTKLQRLDQLLLGQRATQPAYAWRQAHQHFDRLQQERQLLEQQLQQVQTAARGWPMAAVRRHVEPAVADMPLARAAQCLWAMACLHALGAPVGSQGKLLAAVALRVSTLQPNQLAEQAGWRGLAQLVGAAEQSDDVPPEAYVTALARASAHQLRDQLQASNLSAGPLAPRCRYRYRTLAGVRELTEPQPARTSKYLRSTAPKVIVDDFTPISLVPFLRGMHALHGPHLPAELLGAATAHLAASLAPAPMTLAASTKGKSILVSGGDNRQVAKIPVTATSARPGSATLPVEYVKQLCWLLGVEQPAGMQSLAELLLLQLVRTAKHGLPLETALSGLRVSAGLGLQGDNPAVVALLQQVGTALQVELPEASSVEASAVPAVEPSAAPAVEPLATSSAHPDTQALDTGEGAVRQRTVSAYQLTVDQISHLVASLVHLRCSSQLAHGVLLATLTQADDLCVPSMQAWTSSDRIPRVTATARLLTASAHMLPAEDSDTQKKLDTVKGKLFKHLEPWGELNVSGYGGLSGLRFAAALSCWPGHDPDKLKRIAGRVVKTAQGSLTTGVAKEWLSRLQPSLRQSLSIALRKADPMHALLPFFA